MKYTVIITALISMLLLAGCFAPKTPGEKSETVSTTEVETETMDKKVMESDEAMMTEESEEDASMESDETMMGDETEAMSSEEISVDTSIEASVDQELVALSGEYGEYDEAKIGNYEDTVIFFHATWCPSCRAADAGISSEEIPGNLAILKADFDSELDLRKKYSVVSQHTFVHVDAQGNLLKKWVGGTSVQDITDNL